MMGAGGRGDGQGRSDPTPATREPQASSLVCVGLFLRNEVKERPHSIMYAFWLLG